MASLKETKERIASVRSTLKITSAMKMVASAKLHKAQQAAERCAIYGNELAGILNILGPEAFSAGIEAETGAERTAVVAFSSNSSLCGGFNANIIRKAKAVIAECGENNVTVYAVGRKMSEALAKCGIQAEGDWNDLAQHPQYGGTSALAEQLLKGYADGVFSRVLLVWNHLVSTGHQEPSCEVLLPFTAVSTDAGAGKDDEYIIEPDRKGLYADLLPKVIRLKLFTALLDSSAAEHAARTVAMQTATDNGNEILSELTLEYNKGRQAKITAEILDLAGGSIQN